MAALTVGHLTPGTALAVGTLSSSLQPAGLILTAGVLLTCLQDAHIDFLKFCILHKYRTLITLNDELIQPFV